MLFINNSYSDILYDFIKLLFVDIVNDTREKAAFMARGHAPLSDTIVFISMSTAIEVIINTNDTF